MAMWIRRVELTGFAGIASAEVALKPGLNVLHGPNELGKSTLAEAIRAALLLPTTSNAAQALRSWNHDGAPEVALMLEQEAQRIWRVKKRFGSDVRTLEFSGDGEAFSLEGRGREVEGALQGILRWGVRPPGGKGGKKGMPSSFITTALLGDQSDIEAILDASLASDPTDTGKDLLTEALQALAEDPRFKEVLALAQEKIDEAFTPKGAWKKSKGAPMAILAAERLDAQSHFDSAKQKAEHSEAAQANVNRLNQRTLEAEAEAERASAALKVAHQREIATQALDQAQQQLRHAIEQVRSFEQKQAEVTANERGAQALRGELAVAERAVAEVAPRAKEAQERVLQLASGDAEQGRQLRLHEAQNKRLQLQTQATALGTRINQAKTLAANEEAVAAKAADIDKQGETLAEQRELLAEARAATEADNERLAELDRERNCARYRLALVRAEKCSKDLAAMRKHANDAKTLAAQAETKRDEAKALQAPAEAELKRLQQLAGERRVAKAKLAVGLTVDFTPERAGCAEVTIDGETRQRQYAAGERLSYQAERELRLTLDGIGAIDVRGGGRDLQREAQSATERWQTEAAPIFARAGLDPIEGLDALDAKAKHAASLAQEASELDNEAVQARLQSQGIDAAERAATVADAEAARSRLAIVEELEADAALEDVLSASDTTRNEDVIAEEADALQEKVRERDALGIKLATKVELGETALATAKQGLATAQQELAEATPDDEDWRRLLAEGDAEQRKLADDLKAQDAAISAIQAEATAEAEQAKAEQTRLEKELAAKRKARDDFAARLQAKEKQLEGLRGEAKVLEASAKEFDIDALRAVRDHRRTQLEALSVPEAARSEDIAELERAAKDAQADATAARAELATAQGALSQVGGQSIEESATAAQEALAAINRRERELEVDYGGWKLLHDTLAETAKEDAAHLGDALVKPVSERMNALTGGRYEEVGIGPQLDATGIRLGGDERSFGDVSVGTREQIAVLLRLSIAEALESFLILDDHLTQSDPERMAWIRDLLGKAAKNIQVVVMTCHPNAYLTGNEHAVDLTQCITRHGTGA